MAAAPAQRRIPIVAENSGIRALPPLTLYVHFPWCVRKCPYCDFNSHEQNSGFDEAAYVAALIADLECALPQVWGRPVGSVFFGGGTPSLLSGAAVEQLLSALRARLPLMPEAEITLEANPGTVEAARFAAYRAAGVNRLSIGIQSFNDAQLVALGRIHNGAEARRAIDAAQTHFARVNLDLMVALPGQGLTDAARDVEAAIATGVSHISAYQLTLEPNTPFHRIPPPALPNDDQSADMQTLVEERLNAAGLIHYEVSAHARKGEECRHNLNYWRFGDYLGVGPGAHSKLTFPSGIVRAMRHKHPRAWLAAAGQVGGATNPFIAASHRVTAADLPLEFMMNALRLREGVAAQLFSERSGLPLSAIAAALREARARGWLTDDAQRLQATPEGWRWLNRLLELFVAKKSADDRSGENGVRR